MTFTGKLIDCRLRPVSCMWAPPHTGNAGQFVMKYVEAGYNQRRILVVLLWPGAVQDNISGNLSLILLLHRLGVCRCGRHSGTSEQVQVVYVQFYTSDG